MPFGTAHSNAVLDHTFQCGTDDYTPPTAIKIGVSTTAPAKDGSNITEPVGNGYAQITTGAAHWNAASGRKVTNALVLDFPEAEGSWGLLSHYFATDQAGNYLGSGEMVDENGDPAPKSIGAGEILRFKAGDMSFEYDPD